VIEAPGAQWAVVQLHLRLSPWSSKGAEHHPHAARLAAALAYGRSETARDAASAPVLAAGGEIAFFASDELIVVSDALPADDLDVSLKAMERRLRAKNRLLPAPGPVARLPGPSRVPAAVRRAYAPGQPYATQFLPAFPPAAATDLAESAMDPQSLRSLLSEQLRVGEALLVVLAPGDSAKLRKRAWRHVRSQLGQAKPAAEDTTALGPDAGPSPAVWHPPTAPVRVTTDEPSPPARGLYTWAWLRLPAAADDAVQLGAASVLAQLVGGEVSLGADPGWLSLFIPLTDVEDADAAEKSAIERFGSLANDADADTFERARAARLGTSWRALADPRRLALETGRAHLLTGGLSPLAVAVLDGVSLDDARSLAAQLPSAPQVFVRHAPIDAPGVEAPPVEAQP
jgi:hypothetical protein